MHEEEQEVAAAVEEEEEERRVSCSVRSCDAGRVPGGWYVGRGLECVLDMPVQIRLLRPSPDAADADSACKLEP